MFGTSLNNK